MPTATTSPVRTLADIATPDGVFSIIAMDQLNTLRRMFSAVGIEATDEDLRQAKADVARALTPLASGILFDPTYGVPAITGNDALAESCGLLVASEPAERGKFGAEPITYRDPDLDSQWVPSVIENLVYALPGEDFIGKRREDAIIEAARALNEIDCDLLKLEYPGSPEGCRRLAEVLDRPWAVLSAGVPFEDFTRVLRVAFDEGGASGFIAGRSVWRECLPLSGEQRRSFLADVARPRLEQLVAVAADRARPRSAVRT